MNIGYGLALVGFYIFLSTILYIDYQLFLRSGDAIFFKDKSQIEKDLREIQKIEVKNKLENKNNTKEK